MQLYAFMHVGSMDPQIQQIKGLTFGGAGSEFGYRIRFA